MVKSLFLDSSACHELTNKEDELEILPFETKHFELPQYAGKRDTFTHYGRCPEDMPAYPVSFFPDAFKKLSPFIERYQLPAETVIYQGTVFCYCLLPQEPTYTEPFPSYEDIAKSVPAEICYFNKFPGVYFPLVTEFFAKELKRHKFKGLRFITRYDGKKTYPHPQS